MFDALKFGVAIVTDTLFDDYGEADLHYSYSWKYGKTPANDEEAQDMAEKVMKHINLNAHSVYSGILKSGDTFYRRRYKGR